MQLDEYIKETLVQVARGVRGAIDEVDSLGGRVNPADPDFANTGNMQMSQIGHKRPAKQKVKFDIALQVKETSSSGAEAKTKLAVVSFGGGVKSLDESHMTHRIQFEVPVDLPTKLE
ncbi:MAG: hypothetical protein AAGK13_18925 [Pseudomonadota bacterium]|uniref:hypothetical protein n=1 Tax=Vibrio campbellii TaxID=680 RepID=UPI00314BBC0A